MLYSSEFRHYRGFRASMHSKPILGNDLKDDKSPHHPSPRLDSITIQQGKLSSANTDDSDTRCLTQAESFCENKEER